MDEISNIGTCVLDEVPLRHVPREDGHQGGFPWSCATGLLLLRFPLAIEPYLYHERAGSGTQRETINDDS